MEKRKGAGPYKASWYNQKRGCAQIKVSVSRELAARFKACCYKEDKSMAGVLSKYMREYIGTEDACDRPVSEQECEAAF